MRRFRLVAVGVVAVAAVAVPTAVAGTYFQYTGSITTGDVHQTNRVDRNGIVSTCNTSKTNPGTFPDANSYADVYDFYNPSGFPQCVTVRTSPQCGAPYATFTVGYEGYTPANPSTGWLGDEGVSPADGSTGVFSFWADPFSHFQVVVSSVGQNSSTCAFYTLSVSYGKLAKTIPSGAFAGLGFSAVGAYDR